MSVLTFFWYQIPPQWRQGFGPFPYPKTGKHNCEVDGAQSVIRQAEEVDWPDLGEEAAMRRCVFWSFSLRACLFHHKTLWNSVIVLFYSYIGSCGTKIFILWFTIYIHGIPKPEKKWIEITTNQQNTFFILQSSKQNTPSFKIRKNAVVLKPVILNQENYIILQWNK